MPTGLDYGLPGDLVGRAAYEGAYGPAAYEASQRAMALAERQREFDVGLDYHAQESGLRNDLAQQELYQRGSANDANAYADQQRNALYGANLEMQGGLEYARMEDTADYRNQMVAQQQSQQASAVERSRMATMARLAEQQQEQLMQRALSSQKAINDYKGFTSQGEFDQAVQGWEKQFGMAWDYPQRAIADRAQQDFAQRRQQFVGGLAQLTGLDAPMLDSFVVEGEGGTPTLTVDPRLIIGMGESRMNDKRLREIKDHDLEHKREQDDLTLDKERASANQKQVELMAKMAEQRQGFVAKLLLEAAKPITEGTGETLKERERTPEEVRAFVTGRLQHYDEVMGAMPSAGGQAGGIPTFASEAEAEAANIEPGTPVIINGRKAIAQ